MFRRGNDKMVLPKLRTDISNKQIEMSYELGYVVLYVADLPNCGVFQLFSGSVSSGFQACICGDKRQTKILLYRFTRIFECSTLFRKTWWCKHQVVLKYELAKRNHFTYTRRFWRRCLFVMCPVYSLGLWLKDMFKCYHCTRQKKTLFRNEESLILGAFERYLAVCCSWTSCLVSEGEKACIWNGDVTRLPINGVRQSESFDLPYQALRRLDKSRKCLAQLCKLPRGRSMDTYRIPDWMLPAA